MSSERYRTTIRPSELPPKNGVPRYDMSTQSYPEEVTKTEEQLRTELTREGRIYQPIKWACRVGFAGGLIYSLIGIAGPNNAQIIGGTMLWITCDYMRQTLGNTISSWESKRKTFDENFPNGKINLIPERFHPTNLLRRVNPLQLISRK